MFGFIDPNVNVNDTPDVAVFNAPEAPYTRNVADLSGQIRSGGGSITVDANDSRYIVASNNGLRYSVTKLGNGQYRITESTNYLLLIGALVLIGAVVLTRR